VGLERMAAKIRRGVRNFVDAYDLPGDRTVYVLADGRLVNLSAAEGHPAAVMDMSFAVQALATEWVASRRGKLEARVHDVPHEIDEFVAALKLKAMGIEIDRLTSEQVKYLASSDMGT
jgi:adenosylhomocysteinase